LAHLPNPIHTGVAVLHDSNDRQRLIIRVGWECNIRQKTAFLDVGLKHHILNSIMYQADARNKTRMGLLEEIISSYITTIISIAASV
jgi:hypothetical protein